MYTTSPESYRKDLARKWNIYCRFEYIGPYFPYSILNQILVYFSPLLSLSQCAHWLTHRFTFVLLLLYRDSDRLLAIRCLATFQITNSRAGGLYIAFPFFCDLQTTPGPPQYTNLMPHSHFIPFSVIHSLHTKVLRLAI
jgi:hypothetical protein